MNVKSLQIKLVLVFGLCVLVTISTFLIYDAMTRTATGRFIAASAEQTTTDTARELLQEKAWKIAAVVDSELETAMDAARTLTGVFTGVKDRTINLKMDRERLNGILSSTLHSNPTFSGVFTLWEPDALDGLDALYAGAEGHDSTGRFLPYWSRRADGMIQLAPLSGYDSQERSENGIRVGDWYLLPKERQQESPIAPLPYTEQNETVWMTSQVAPILVEETFYGIVGINMRLEFVQQLVEEHNAGFYGGEGRMAVVSYEGILVAASDASTLTGHALAEWLPESWEEDLKTIQIQQGIKTFTGDTLKVIVPIDIGRSQRPWAVIAEVPQTAVLADTHTLLEELSARATRDLVSLIIVGTTITFVVLIVIWFISKGIVLPLKKGVDFAQAVANGDLTAKLDVQSNDEIGMLADAMRQMLVRLRGIIGDVKEAANNVAESSQAMNSNASRMSDGAAMQASAAEEASSSMEEMASNIRQNSDNALQTEKIATQAARDAKESSMAVGEAVEAMQEIAQKISIIEEITEQTQMLSLNATIEAARAQEHGRGFAVVAAEVRALAKRSKTAATEINELAGRSMMVAEKAGNMLQQLVPRIQQTAELVQEISAASKEQSTGTNQINRSIQQLDGITQQNAATSEELSATAEELSNQAGSLQKTISFFRVDAVRHNEPDETSPPKKLPDAAD